jgi:class 3 adenylate cyclase
MGADRSATVLIVDDVPANVALLAHALGGSYRTRVATSGERALRLCASGPLPDLVLLDVMMPDLDGFEVCRRLRADPRTADVPVILVTARAQPSDEAEGFEAGAVDYVTKPISPLVVRKRVELHLELRAARKRLEQLSGHYSAYLAPELTAGIRRGEIGRAVASQRKVLTVLLSDIQGFTRRTEELGPEEMTTLLNAYFEHMTRVVRSHGGTLDKFIGDAILVFFGDPTSRGEAEDARACVDLAIAMQRALPELDVKHAAGLAMRIGVATGPCTVGNFGSSDQLSYTVLGTPVNLAARLEARCAPGRVLVSEATRALVGDDRAWEAIEPLSVKGLIQPVRAWMPTP